MGEGVIAAPELAPCSACLSVIRKEQTLNYYAGMKLYCIDKDHPYYNKRVEVGSPYKELKDGTPILCDPITGKTVELREDQISLYPPDERD